MVRVVGAVRTARSFVALAALGALGAWALGAAGATPDGPQAAGASPAASALPFMDDPLGPLVDVTADWGHYQPSPDFCVKPDVAEFPADTAPVLTGAAPVCAASGFGPSDTGLVEVRISAPPLCATCRRLFVDYSRIAPDAGLVLGAHGHAYFRPMSFNPGYTVGVTAHSPNVKNLTNDTLVSPPGTPVPTVLSVVDLHAMAYVGDTAHTAHIAAQGPYYAGPWYVNAAGQRIEGAYLDLDTSSAWRLPLPQLNDVVYAAGFSADPSLCPDAVVLGAAYADGNYLYAGCVDWFGASALPGVDPWSGG